MSASTATGQLPRPVRCWPHWGPSRSGFWSSASAREKQTALEAVRHSLRESGHRPEPHPRDNDKHAAVVIDDAHRLKDSELHLLADLADDPERTVVVAGEPRDHDPAA